MRHEQGMTLIDFVGLVWGRDFQEDTHTVLRFIMVPSNLLISSGGHNFVTLAAKLCDHLVGLFHKISKFFKNKLSLKYFCL